MAAYQTQQVNVGSIAAPDVGSVFANFADRINKQQNSQLDNMRQAAQFDRQQVLNQRADQEWNREIGLRDARKNIAAEFTANPYAAKFGSGKETAMLDKQVLDYVNNGGEINEDLAKRLQARYEEALPFREDAANAIASRMIALGEDPTKAKQEADVLASGQLLSKADKQARLDAQQQMAQKYYDEWAKANLEAAKMNVDIGKANLNADTDITKLKLQAGMGGTGSGGSTGVTGGIGGNWYDAQQTIEKMDFGGIDTRTVAKPFLETAKALGYSPNQAVLALKQGADLGLIDNTFDVEKSKAFLQKMTPMQTSVGGTRLDMAVSGSQFMPQFAPKQIAGYDPKGFLEGSRSTLPELFRGDPNKITEETKVSNPDIAKNVDTFTQQTKKVESGNNYNSVNKESGAMGAYQFLPSTLNDYRGKHGLPNFTNEEFLNNKDLQDKVFSEFTKDNAHKLEVLGIEPTPLNLYAAHNLGVGNVKELNSNSENMSNRLQRALAANHLDSKEDWFSRNASKFDVKPTSKYTNLKLPEATKQVYKDITELYSKNTPEVYQGQTALNASRNNMSEEDYKKYLDWAAKEDPGIRPILEGYTGTTTEDNAKTFLRQQDIAAKYLDNPSKLTATESRWIKESRQTPNGRKLLASLGIY